MLTLNLLSRIFPNSRQWVRITISFAICCIFILHSSRNMEFQFITKMENYFYDKRINLTMPNTVDPKVVIIDIDEHSLAEIGQWPWSRDIIALMIDKLFDDYQISILGFDVVFAEADDVSALNLLRSLQTGPYQDNPVIQQIVNEEIPKYQTDDIMAGSLVARNVILGFAFKKNVAENEDISTGSLPNPIGYKQDLEHLKINYYRPRGFVGNLQTLQDTALSAGFFDFPREDEIMRKVPIVQLYEDNLYGSLSLSMIIALLNNPPIHFQFDQSNDEQLSGLGLESLQVGDYTIPVDERVSSFIPFRGPQYSFPYVSASDILFGQADPEVLKDKLVLVGTSAAGLLDLRATPVGKAYAGVEVHANILSGILEGSIKTSPSYTIGIEICMLLLYALLMARLFPLLPPLWTGVFVIFLFASTAAINLWFWQSANIIIPIASTILYILTASFVLEMYSFFIESRNKRRLSQVFSQYIPGELVVDVDQNEAEMTLAGESRDMSVLFSDVRSFTTLSEGLESSELTHLMNEFLTPITRAIHLNKGTIDKYMGDAVMAFWGAPMRDEFHANNAVATALDMIQAMQELDITFKERGWPTIRIGVGISSGMMNVGNMGSEFRMAYTVMGDTVNLGSRLEGLTKSYGVDIIVNKQTSETATDFTFREIDRVKVKGKTLPVSIHEPICATRDLSSQQEDMLAQYYLALAHYFDQNWLEAEILLKILHGQSQEKIYEIYLDRISHHKVNPPGDDWDGIFIHTTK